MVDWLPRAEGFLYCITLRFGVYIIALFDFVSGIMTLGRFLPRPSGRGNHSAFQV